MDADEAAAVARAKGGDGEAFRMLVERHGRTIYRLAYRITGRADEAEDVTQETFVRAYTQLGRFGERSSFATWLYRIAVNCALDALRARSRREITAAPEMLEQLAGEVAQPSGESRLYARQVGVRVERALQLLTPQERAAFILRHYQGCSTGEIAEVLGVKANAAKHAVFRAVKKLRAALRPLAEPAREGERCGRSQPATPACPVKS